MQIAALASVQQLLIALSFRTLVFFLDATVFDFLIKGGQLDSTKVRVFYTSKPYLDYVYVARKDVSESERERFVRALLALRPRKDDPVLRSLRADKFVTANDQEYTVTRQIANELNMF